MLSKRRVAHITMHYQMLVGQKNRPASFRTFAAWLSEALSPYQRGISHQSIKNWVDKKYLPDRSLIFLIAQGAAHDIRGEFAQDILAAVDPMHFSPATEIGKLALQIGEQQEQ